MSDQPQLWARVQPHLARRHPGLPVEWVPVVERNDETLYPEPLEGFVWLAPPGGKQLHVPARRLEFRDTPPEGP